MNETPPCIVDGRGARASGGDAWSQGRGGGGGGRGTSAGGAEAAGVEVGAVPPGPDAAADTVSVPPCRPAGAAAGRRVRLGQFRRPRRVVRRPLGRCRWPRRAGACRAPVGQMGHGGAGRPAGWVPGSGDDRAGAAPWVAGDPGWWGWDGGWWGWNSGWRWNNGWSGPGMAVGWPTDPWSGPGHRFRSTPGRMRACRNWAGPRDRRGALRPEAVPPARPIWYSCPPVRPGISPMFSNAGRRRSRSSHRRLPPPRSAAAGGAIEFAAVAGGTGPLVHDAGALSPMVMKLRPAWSVLAASLLLGACATVPGGPSVEALPVPPSRRRSSRPTRSPASSTPRRRLAASPPARPTTRPWRPTPSRALRWAPRRVRSSAPRPARPERAPRSAPVPACCSAPRRDQRRRVLVCRRARHYDSVYLRCMYAKGDRVPTAPSTGSRRRRRSRRCTAAERCGPAGHRRMPRRPRTRRRTRRHRRIRHQHAGAAVSAGRHAGPV